jgi:hypothetical protein
MAMYEQSGRYYAFFGPSAAVTPEETRFLAHWAKAAAARSRTQDRVDCAGSLERKRQAP